MKNFISLMAVLILLAGCNQYQKTPSGVAYSISGNSKTKIKQGQIFKYNIEIKIAPKDSIFSTTFGRIPGFMQFDTTRVSPHSFLELISKCGEGDKVNFSLSVDSLKKLGLLEYNQFFRKNDLIKGRMEIVKVYKGEEEANNDYKKEMDQEQKREAKELKDYAAKKSLKVQELPSGVLVVVEQAGDTMKANPGRTVSMMYKGYFTNDKVFDANMGSTAVNKEPLVFQIGSGGVIPGLESGLAQFGKGGKGTILIPALQAYGIAGQPPMIPPYSNLLFDIEVTDVSLQAPPAPAPMPGAPQGQPQRK
ncbi:MAG: FKBP-type peptidyl-prolyl cis-trans isomerase [Chitinophagaceae bacterium]|jgi:FKBP-type peptidyl-prolyl cis-trans isomerase FkpA|nr:FKBP-type peptidyl-prolyl cis-trans isomerase [Chitinophagaceae bacterium]MCA6471427.1 FKBP-type peptidyl-prolyl cis-trans isomerase [Chitinophagaceae bacterium]MCA6478846.1 FKBP-type peptidyl-prolyl cis-trans isomerase [Chitinophagaceae bacterium]MCA6480963.1 FKBP-type peptidyl-prolyl cis-trans isomerase [Chitinophagaceae bacterium]